MHPIIQQIVNVVKQQVVNQAKYIYPTTFPEFEYDGATMEDGAELMSDEVALSWIEHKHILSNRALMKLITEMGVEAVYNEDGWIDFVAEHIIKYRADCRELWDTIAVLGKTNKNVDDVPVLCDNLPTLN